MDRQLAQRVFWRSLSRILVAVILPLAALVSLTGLPATRPVFARPLLQAGDVIALVNQLRTANGLPPYKVNNALMAAAQGHSDWQAATGTTSHTGAGGSRPRDRAIAAGYGGGAAVYVSENIATGTNNTPAWAVQMWQGDSVHLNTMLSPQYTDAGAGVASGGNVTYITLNVGYIAGQAGSNPPAPITTQPPGSTPVSPSQKFIILPVATVTPQSDGSIVHIVQPGEVLLNIAAAYKVALAELYKLNNLNDKSVIYPNERVIIKGPDPTATPTATSTPTRIPTATRRPTRTPTQTVAAPRQTPTPSPVPPDLAAQGAAPDPLLIAIGGLLLVGIGLVIAGTLLKKK